MEGLWGFKSYTTCVRCPHRAKTKDQYGELKKWLTRRDIAGPETRSTNNYSILNLKGKYLWLNKGVFRAKI